MSHGLSLLGHLEYSHASVNLLLLTDSEAVCINPCTVYTVQCAYDRRDIVKGTWAGKLMLSVDVDNQGDTHPERIQHL